MPGTYDAPPDQKGGGDPNILKIKDGVTKIHPLDNMLAGWRQHGIEHPSDTEQFASMVCPGARSCPLCRKPVDAQGKQRFPVSRRYAANVYDFETNQFKVLIGGPQIFDELKAAASVGVVPSSCDWSIIRTGTGRSTEYKVINHGQTQFDRPVTPEMLHDIAKYEQPASAEAIFEMLEKFGIDYDALETPSYTYDEALAFTMPYGKHKGLTVEQLLSKEVDYAEYIHSSKLEQGALGDPVFLALQVALEEQGLVPALEEALEQLPAEVAPASAPAAATAAAPDPKDQGVPRVPIAGGVTLRSPIGIEGEYPPEVVESLLTVGFTQVEPEPEPEPQAVSAGPVKVLIAGNEVELPADQAQGLIDAGTATLVQETAAAQPEEPKLPLPDELVQVNIGGTDVPMPYGQAYPLVDAGSASFLDEQVAQAHARVSAGEAANKAKDPSGTQPPVSPSTTRQHDPEKPFECDQCEKAFKTQGALTQHSNREHKAAEPQPSAVPPRTNGSVSDRVKEKIQAAPFARDYTVIMAMMEEATGTKNFAQMSEEQLLKLEQRLDAELAKA